MTTVTATAHGLPVHHDHVGIPFGRLVKTELRKLTDTRASKWLLIAIVAITPIIVAVTLFAAAPKDLTYSNLVDYTQTPQKILLPALGILAITSEWSQRTGLVTFTLVPRRWRVLAAKFAATLALGLLVIAIAFAAAGAGNVLGAELRHGDGRWAFGASGFGEITLVQLTGLVQGMAIGMLLLITAAAIVSYYLVPNLWSVLFSSVKSLKPAAPWFDLNKAQSPLYTHDMTGAAWLHLSVAAAIWVAVPLVLGAIRVRRTEVRSS